MNQLRVSIGNVPDHNCGILAIGQHREHRMLLPRIGTTTRSHIPSGGRILPLAISTTSTRLGSQIFLLGMFFFVPSIPPFSPIKRTNISVTLSSLFTSCANPCSHQLLHVLFGLILGLHFLRDCHDRAWLGQYCRHQEVMVVSIRNAVLCIARILIIGVSIVRIRMRRWP